MVRFTVSAPIAADRATVWRVLADHGNIASWSSGLASSGLLTKNGTGVGAVRTCMAKNGVVLEERITEWDEGDGYVLVFDKIPAPVKDVRARFRLAGDAPTEVFADHAYKGKGIVVLVAPLMKPVFRKAMRGPLKDLEAACDDAAGGTGRA